MRKQVALENTQQVKSSILFIKSCQHCLFLIKGNNRRHSNHKHGNKGKNVMNELMWV